jgi:hypothetical protein
VLWLATIYSDFVTGIGGVAAMIAIGAFIGQISPGLAEAPDARVRRDAVLGGIGGIACAIIVFGLSVASQ